MRRSHAALLGALVLAAALIASEGGGGGGGGGGGAVVGGGGGAVGGAGEEVDPGPPPSPSSGKKSKRAGRKTSDDAVLQVREWLTKMKTHKGDAAMQAEGCEKIAELAAASSEALAEVAAKGIPRIVGGMHGHPHDERLQEAGCWALSTTARIVDASQKLGLAAQSRHLGVVSPSLTDAELSEERNFTDKVLEQVAKSDGIQTLVDALRRHAPAGRRMSDDVPSESMMECGLTLLAGLSGLDTPGPREPEPRKWQISRAGGIEGVVRSMMANPGSQVVQHRGTQILRNLHTQLTDWAHKHRTEVAEVGIVEGILLSLEMHPGAAAVQENGLFVLTILASNQGSNLEHNINLGRSLISAPTASAREDLDITRENVAAAGGVAAAVRGMRAHPDEVMVQLAGAWLIETLMRWTPTAGATTPMMADRNGLHGDAVVLAEGDRLVVDAMRKHPTHHKLQQVGCSILASLSQAGSDPVLPIMPRALADMPHRIDRQYRYYEIVRWLLSKLPFYSSRSRTTPTSDNNGGDGLLPDAIKPEAAEVILNAIMLTTGETDRPWSFAKHGTNGDRYAAHRRTEGYKTAANTAKSCMQSLSDLVYRDPLATRAVLGDRQLRVSDGVTKVLHAMRSHNVDTLAQEYGCTTLRQLAASADATISDPSLADGSGVRPSNCWKKGGSSGSGHSGGGKRSGGGEQCTYAIGSQDIIAHIDLDQSFDQAESCMQDWRWVWASPRVFFMRSFRSYQAHQDKHQTFFAIVRVMSITSVSWYFCTNILWPIYDRVLNAIHWAVYGKKRTAQQAGAAEAEGQPAVGAAGNGNGNGAKKGAKAAADGCATAQGGGRAHAGSNGNGNGNGKGGGGGAGKGKGKGGGKVLSASEIAARAKKASKRAAAAAAGR